MSTREKIAGVLAVKFTAPNGQLLDAADAILSAMPEIVRGMVKPLVWEGDAGDMVAKSGLGYYVISCNSARVEIHIGYGTLTSVIAWRDDKLGRTLEAAKAAANDHHAAQLLAGLGLTAGESQT